MKNNNNDDVWCIKNDILYINKYLIFKIFVFIFFLFILNLYNIIINIIIT